MWTSIRKGSGSRSKTHGEWNRVGRWANLRMWNRADCQSACVLDLKSHPLQIMGKLELQGKMIHHSPLSIDQRSLCHDINPRNFWEVHALGKRKSCVFIFQCQCRCPGAGDVRHTVEHEGSCCQVAPVWIQSGPSKSWCLLWCWEQRPQGSEMSKTFTVQWHSQWLRNGSQGPETQRSLNKVSEV